MRDVPTVTHLSRLLTRALYYDEPGLSLPPAEQSHNIEPRFGAQMQRGGTRADAATISFCKPGGLARADMFL